MRRWLYCIEHAAVATLLVAVILALGYTFLSTGPNCPGMDPEWIGWCQSPGTTE